MISQNFSTIWYCILYHEYWPPRISMIFTKYSKGFDITSGIKSIDLPKYQWYSPNTRKILISHLISRELASQNINYIHQVLKKGFDITSNIKSIGLPEYQWYLPSTQKGLDITSDIKSIVLLEYQWYSQSIQRFWYHIWYEEYWPSKMLRYKKFTIYSFCLIS